MSISSINASKRRGRIRGGPGRRDRDSRPQHRPARCRALRGQLNRPAGRDGPECRRGAPGCSVFRRPSSISGNPVHRLRRWSPRSRRQPGLRAVPPVETSSKPRADEAAVQDRRSPVLSETLSRALGITDKVQYYPCDAGRACALKGKAADAAFFFAPAIQTRRGWFKDGGRNRRHSTQE